MVQACKSVIAIGKSGPDSRAGSSLARAQGTSRGWNAPVASRSVSSSRKSGGFRLSVGPVGLLRLWVSVSVSASERTAGNLLKVAGRATLPAGSRGGGGRGGETVPEGPEEATAPEQTSDFHSEVMMQPVCVFTHLIFCNFLQKKPKESLSKI